MTSERRDKKGRSGASLTREGFLLSEMKLVAGLLAEGESEKAIIEAVAGQNLFQYPTTTNCTRIARACLARLQVLESPALVQLMAQGTPAQAVQVNLVAMMLAYPIVQEFLAKEIGGRLRAFGSSFTAMDMNVFMTRYQVENPRANWTDATARRVKAALATCLYKGGYQEKGSEELRPVLLDATIEQELRTRGLTGPLGAFECL